MSVRDSRALDRWKSRQDQSQEKELAKIPNRETMPFGKHKGWSLTSLPLDYLTWAAGNIQGEIGRKLQQELWRREQAAPGGPAIKEPKKIKKRDRDIPDDSETHYRWEDRTGKVHMIPKDVDMDGRENEECPFDASVAVMESEPMGELDREFRAMFR